MKWFKHFSKMHDDRAIEKLIAEFGIAGYGLYCYCLEIIAGSVDADNITFELEPDAELLARRLTMDTVLVEKIMHRCIEFQLFELADSGRITCVKIAKFIDQATSNPEIRKIARVTKYDNSSDESRRSQTKSDQIRLDEIRRDKKEREKSAPKDVHGSLKNVLLTQAEYLRLEEEYGDMIVDDYVERLSLWLPNAAKKPKDHNATLRTWLRKDKVAKAYRPAPCPECGGRVVDGQCRNVECPQYA